MSRSKAGSNKEDTIPFAEWPDDAPYHLEESILTVICGNSHLRWSMHSGLKDNFAPILFWRYVRKKKGLFLLPFVFAILREGKGSKPCFCGLLKFCILLFHVSCHLQDTTTDRRR